MDCCKEFNSLEMIVAFMPPPSKIPVTAKTMNVLSPEELSFFELYASRFSKLQDFMGSNLFTALLENAGEQTETYR